MSLDKILHRQNLAEECFNIMTLCILFFVCLDAKREDESDLYRNVIVIRIILSLVSECKQM
jgi:hypothetical protein